MAAHGQLHPDRARPGPERPAAGDPLEDLDAAATAYAERIAGAGDAERAALRDELTRLCLPFARRLAKRYRGRGEAFEDLEQVARLGLVKAVDRYDPRRGSFTAYASITMAGELKRHFRDRTWGVHVPRRVQDLSLEVGHALTSLTGTLSRTPTAAEVATLLHVSTDAVLEAVESAAGYTPASLNTLVAEGGRELGELIGAPDYALELVADRITVTGLLLRLPARERQMLEMRFYANRTQAEIATELGISQMHVSRLLGRALSWLRAAMLSDTPPRWEGADARQGMELAVDRADGTATVRVRGEVDRDTAARLRRGLRYAVGAADTDSVVIDLSGVPLVDAAGVAALLEAAAAANAAEVGLRLTGAQPYVSRILAVTGLAYLLTDPE